MRRVQKNIGYYIVDYIYKIELNLSNIGTGRQLSKWLKKPNLPASHCKNQHGDPLLYYTDFYHATTVCKVS